MSRTLPLIGLTLAVLVLIGSGSPRAAGPLPFASRPEDVGLSSERLERLTTVTKGHIDSGLLGGAVTLIARGGRVAYFKNLGYRDRASSNAPMPADAIFRLASMTKPVVSVAAMMLQEQGRFQINDPVAKYLPELAHMTVGLDRVPVNREMTIQDLLRHTSGFTAADRGTTPIHKMYEAAGVVGRDRRSDLTNADLVTEISKLPLLHQPGTRWEYGRSTDVLGRLIEVVSGQTLGAFLSERIFRPLAMNDTGFFTADSNLARVAQPWTKRGGAPLQPRFDVSVIPRFESGAGGLVSTASDYLRFCQMMLDGGIGNGVRLLSPKTVDFMTADHLGDMPGQDPGMGFGLGFQVRRTVGLAKQQGSAGDYGWAGNVGTIFRIDPQEQFIAIYMVQVNPEDRVYLRDQFITLAYQAIVGPIKPISEEQR